MVFDNFQNDINKVYGSSMITFQISMVYDRLEIAICIMFYIKQAILEGIKQCKCMVMLRCFPCVDWCRCIVWVGNSS